MRSGFALLCLVGLLGPASADAETRIFMLAGYSDGYGVNHCLATRDRTCGHAVADSYCRSHDYLRAVTFRKITRYDASEAAGRDGLGCRGGVCSDFIAIECFR